MNRTVTKIFLCFSLSAAFISTLLLIINFFGILFIGSDSVFLKGDTPQKKLSEISKSLIKTDSGYALKETVLPKEDWAILLDDNGKIIWSQNKPSDIPDSYSIKDIAVMSKWFLNDYPVYMRTDDRGLIILGIPKNAVGKYPVEYSSEWFRALPQKIFTVIIINLCLALLLASAFGIGLYLRLRTLVGGINDLRREKRVRLEEKGIFKELSQAINDTSKAMERKNAALSERDNARSDWIAGISHDIRTPLSIILGNAELIESSAEANADLRLRGSVTKKQSLRIKKLIDDLNLISSLEYDMQPSEKTPVGICSLIREIVSDMINTGISDKYEISLNLRDERAVVNGDRALLERALFNLVSNSIVHNKDGCRIKISEYIKDKNIIVLICDNGSGAPKSVLKMTDRIPRSAHGLGLPMAYKIISVHGGKMTAENRSGLCVKISLPLSY